MSHLQNELIMWEQITYESKQIMCKNHVNNESDRNRMWKANELYKNHMKINES